MKKNCDAAELPGMARRAAQQNEGGEDLWAGLRRGRGGGGRWRYSLRWYSLCLSVFPVGAGLGKNPEAYPNWWGRLDVGIAFLLAALALLVMALAGSKFSKPIEDATYRAYRVMIHGLWMMLVVFFLWGDRIAWKYCLVGLAWRAWLLLYSLPAWITLFGTQKAEG